MSSIKRVVVFALFFQILCLNLKAQNNIQSDVNEIIESKETDTSKIKLLLKGGYALALSGDSNTFIYTTSIFNLLKDNYSNTYIKLRSKANNVKGICFMYKGKYDSATYFYTESLKLGEKYHDDNIVATGFNNLGSIYNYTADFEKAVSYNYKALELFEKLKDSSGIAGAYGNLANNFTRLKQFPKAIELVKQAISYAVKLDNKRMLANSYNTLATIYGEQKQDSLELLFTKKSFNLYLENKNIKGLTSTTSNLSEIYLKRDMFDSVQKYSLLGIAYCKEIDDDQNMASLYYHLGESYRKQKKLYQALMAQDSVIFYALQTGDKLQLSLAYQEESAIYNTQGDFKAAFENLGKYADLNDSIFNIKMESSVAEMQTKYETAKKEQTIQQQKFELSKKQYLIYGSLCLLVLISSLSFFYFKNSKLKNEKRLQTELLAQQTLNTKAIIDAEEKERKRIAGDLHDGIGQLFSAVKMNLEMLVEKFVPKQLDAMQLSEKTLAMVDESCTEVRSIAHQMMPNALIKAGLVSALRDFVNQIPTEKLKISIETKGLEERLESNIETVLYRVIQESVNNVVKHANATELHITLLRDTQEVTAAIEDNGKGFDTKNIIKLEGIGLKNMITRIEYLKGNVEISSTPNKGTLVSIYVPLNS